MSEEFLERRKDDRKLDELLLKVNEIHQRQNEVVIPKLAHVDAIEKVLETQGKVLDTHDTKLCDLWDAKRQLTYAVFGALVVAILGVLLKK